MAIKSVNSTEVARRAGVSRTTVSFVLNGHEESARIPIATRERVLLAAEELGYQPNHMARILQSGRSYLIRLLIRRVHPAFFSRSIAAFQSTLAESGYDLRVQETVGWNAEHWKASAADRWPADGLIVIESVESVAALLEVTQGHVPIVNVGAVVSPNVDHVAIDMHDSTVAAVRYLQTQGRSRIVYLGTPYVIGTTRAEAYFEAMQETAVAPRFLMTDEQWDESERALGMRAVASALAAGETFDALVCFNDELAIGAMRAFKERGLRVPDDIAIIGCDDIEETEYHDPPLSTIHYPYQEAARKAWNMLRRRIEEPETLPQSVTVPSTLTLRQSSAASRR